MATAVIMPQQGNSVQSCLITSWKKQPGDAVAEGDVICEVETDKAVFQVESQTSGILLERFYEVNQEAPVMTNIAVIGEPGEDIEAFRPERAPQKASAPAPRPAQPIVESTQTVGDGFISPRARNLAQASGILVSNINGSGPGGRIIERDIQAAINKQPPLTRGARQTAQSHDGLPQVGSGIGGRVTTHDLQSRPESPAQSPEDVETIPLRGVRRITAERMVASLQTTAQLTLNASADARALLAFRKRLKNSPESRGLQQVTINDLLLYAVSRTLQDHPELNATFQDETITRYPHIHLGFAVDTPRGLLVPVIRHADDLSLKRLAEESKRLAAASADGKVTPDNLRGGTFTVTNLGGLGIESFTPILNPPQVAILGVGNINLKPVQGDDDVEFIPHMHLSLTIDHQVVDGAPGARFLQALAQDLANIEMLLAL